MFWKKLERHQVEKEKKAPLIIYVTGKRKSSKKLDSLDHSGPCYVINNYDVRKGGLVADLNAKEKDHLFFRLTAKQTK